MLSVQAVRLAAPPLFTWIYQLSGAALKEVNVLPVEGPLSVPFTTMRASVWNCTVAPAWMVSVRVALMVTSPSTIHGLPAAVQVVFAAMAVPSGTLVWALSRAGSTVSSR